MFIAVPYSQYTILKLFLKLLANNIEVYSIFPVVYLLVNTTAFNYEFTYLCEIVSKEVVFSLSSLRFASLRVIAGGKTIAGVKSTRFYEINTKTL
ncbi:hypothetical protein C5S39_02730 [Candidatus Methanophagaceae archaeon]|jgi:hypothetical protein|nr:hypothetical protein C5S39_02730 [Methanophagales archaeon]